MSCSGGEFTSQHFVNSVGFLHSHTYTHPSWWSLIQIRQCPERLAPSLITEHSCVSGRGAEWAEIMFKDQTVQSKMHQRNRVTAWVKERGKSLFTGCFKAGVKACVNKETITGVILQQSYDWRFSCFYNNMIQNRDCEAESSKHYAPLNRGALVQAAGGTCLSFEGQCRNIGLAWKIWPC